MWLPEGFSWQALRETFFKIGCDIVPAPAGIAEFTPGIVIVTIPTRVDARIQGRGAAEDLSTRVGEALAFKIGLFFGLEAPIERPAQHLGPCQRSASVRAGVSWTGFEEEDIELAKFAEAGGDDAASRASADNDVVCYQAFSLRLKGRGRPRRGVMEPKKGKAIGEFSLDCRELIGIEKGRSSGSCVNAK